jgi:hypothetical protein
VGEVEFRDLPAIGLIGFFERPRQYEERESAFVMNPGAKQCPDQIAAKGPKLAGNPVQIRGVHSKPEVLARGIIRTSLEKPEVTGAWPVARHLAKCRTDVTYRRRLYRPLCLHSSFSPVTVRNRPYA